MDQKDTANALRQAITDIMNPDALSKARGYLSFLGTGKPLLASEMTWVQQVPFVFLAKSADKDGKPSPDTKNAVDAQFFAKMVNTIPTGVGDWADSANSLDNWYRDFFLDGPSLSFEKVRPSRETEAKIKAAEEALGAPTDRDLAKIDKLKANIDGLNKDISGYEDDLALKQADLDGFADELRNLTDKEDDDELTRDEKTRLRALRTMESDVARLESRIGSAEDKRRDYAKNIEEITNAQRTAILDAYEEKQKEFQTAEGAFLEQMVSDPSNIVAVRTARTAMDNARESWERRGKKDLVEKNFAILQQWDGRGIEKALANQRTRYDGAAVSNDAGNGPFVPVRLSPRGFLTDRSAWNKIERTENKESDSTVDINMVASRGTGPGLFWRSDQNSIDSEVKTVSSAASNIEVTFEISRVGINRSDWFDPSILKSGKWGWAEGSENTELISDGEIGSERTDLALPMIATEMIVARNVKITMSMDESVSKDWEKTTKSTSRSGFWIFSSSRTTTTKETGDSYSWKDGKATINMPGPQIIAYICDRMPKLPDPTFTPST